MRSTGSRSPKRRCRWIACAVPDLCRAEVHALPVFRSLETRRVLSRWGAERRAVRVDDECSSRSALAHAAPSPEVIAATELLLAQPDAYRYRRRYLELIIRGRGSGVASDYTAAERYLLRTADACRRSLRRNNSSPAED